MARPTKHNVDYFSHDCSMRNDIKIKALRRKYKHLGYSIYIITLELLGDTEYFQMKWNDDIIELLTPEYDCDGDELKEIINYCIQLDLLQIHYGYLHCEQFTKRLEDTVLSRRKDYCSNNSPINKLKGVNDVNNDINDDNNGQSKGKESKLKEIKLEQSIPNETKLNDSEVKVYSFKFCNDIYNTIMDDFSDDTEWLEALETADTTILWNNFYSVLGLSESNKDNLKTIISERLEHLKNKHLVDNLES